MAKSSTGTPSTDDPYGFVATRVIEVNGVRAFNPGDFLGQMHVDNLGLEADSYAPRDSAEAAKVNEVTPAPAPEVSYGVEENAASQTADASGTAF